MSELTAKSMELLFGSIDFEVFCMSRIQSHPPGGEKSPNRIATVQGVSKKKVIELQRAIIRELLGV
jgi:hypothetical protein